MTRWGFGRLVRQLEAVTTLVARALPLLALLVTFLFLTQEVWQTAGDLAGVPYWLVVCLFPLVGVLFLVSRIPTDVGELNRFDDPDEIGPLSRVDAGCGGADRRLPAATAARRVANGGTSGSWRCSARGCRSRSSACSSAASSCCSACCWSTRRRRSTGPDKCTSSRRSRSGQQDLVLTEQLLRVAGFLTAFSGLNFTVYLVTDLTYRREFRGEVVGELRQAFAVRGVPRLLDADRGRRLRPWLPPLRLRRPDGERAPLRPHYPVPNVIEFHVGAFSRSSRCRAR